MLSKVNVKLSNSSHLKCLAILPCDLSVITIHISDWHHFSDSHISQSSLATYLSRVGILKKSLLQICYQVCRWKKCENRWSFDVVMGKSLVSCFFDSRCTSLFRQDCSLLLLTSCFVRTSCATYNLLFRDRFVCKISCYYRGAGSAWLRADLRDIRVCTGYTSFLFVAIPT